MGRQCNGVTFKVLNAGCREKPNDGDEIGWPSPLFRSREAPEGRSKG